MRGKIDTIYGWLRVVKTRPVSYKRLDHCSTTLNVKVKPPKTSLGVMVEEMKEWTTNIPNLENQTTFRLAGN